jgi:hypothetical protein
LVIVVLNYGVKKPYPHGGGYPFVQQQVAGLLNMHLGACFALCLEE